LSTPSSRSRRLAFAVVLVIAVAGMQLGGVLRAESAADLAALAAAGRSVAGQQVACARAGGPAGRRSVMTVELAQPDL
jgi:hypothetical protein